jgi:hypothetical protein
MNLWREGFKKRHSSRNETLLYAIFRAAFLLKNAGKNGVHVAQVAV